MKKILNLLFLIFLGIIIYFLSNFFLQKNGIYITQNQKSIVNFINSIGKLETAEMNIQKNLEIENKLKDIIPTTQIDDKIRDFLFKDKLLLEIEGKIIAGFDLNKIKTGDIQILANNVIIKLPEPEILNVILLTGTKVFYRQLGLLTKGNFELETIARNEAKKQLKEEAIKEGILEIAKQNANKIIKNLLQKIDKNINIKIKFNY